MVSPIAPPSLPPRFVRSYPRILVALQAPGIAEYPTKLVSNDGRGLVLKVRLRLRPFDVLAG